MHSVFVVQSSGAAAGQCGSGVKIAAYVHNPNHGIFRLFDPAV